MNLAFEVPDEYLSEFRAYSDYDFVLAQRFVTSAYSDHFTSCRGLRFLILDNGMYELGTPVDTYHLLQKIKQLHPSCVVGPDYAQEMERTISETISLALQAPVPVLGVLQGKSAKELLKCYEVYDRLPCIKRIGVPLRSLPVEGIEMRMVMRHDLLNIIARTGPSKPFHILSAASALDLQYCAQFDFVETADTSLPVLFAIHDRRLDTLIDAIREPGWRLNFSMRLTEEQLCLTKENMAFLRRICGRCNRKEG